MRFCIQKLNIMHVLYVYQLVYVKMASFFLLIGDLLTNF